MKIIFFAFVILNSLSFAYSQDKKIEEFLVDSEASYSSFEESSKSYLKQYFSNLKELGIAEKNKFYISDLDMGNFTLDPFGILAPLPEREINCQYIFCRDIDLQKRLNQEINNGRLVLITHTWAGYNAAAIDSDSPVIQKIFNDLEKRDLSKKSIMVITPNTSLDILEHELFHADDHLNSKLEKMLKDLEFLITDGKADCNSALKRVSRSYVMEMRAYIHQENYLKNTIRGKEFRLKESNSEETVEEFETESYKENELQMITVKKNYYQDKLERAISKAVLKEGQLENIREIIDVIIKFNE